VKSIFGDVQLKYNGRFQVPARTIEVAKRGKTVKQYVTYVAVASAWKYTETYQDSCFTALRHNSIPCVLSPPHHNRYFAPCVFVLLRWLFPVIADRPVGGRTHGFIPCQNLSYHTALTPGGAAGLDPLRVRSRRRQRTRVALRRAMPAHHQHQALQRCLRGSVCLLVCVCVRACVRASMRASMLVGLGY
jgi:hypothetical protein